VRRVSTPADEVVVVGAGCSALITDLVDDGYASITAVDISAAAMSQLESVLGDRSTAVETVVSDVCDFASTKPVAVWHDRATFHFLTDVDARSRYVERVAASVAPGGHLVLSGFAPDGPLQCSGLDVARHSLDDLAALFGADFDLVEHANVEHVTPWDSTQHFLHTLMQRRSSQLVSD